MKKIFAFVSLVFFFVTPSLLARNDSYQYDTDPPQDTADSTADDSAITGIAKGVKRVAYEGPKDFAKETVKEIPKKPPIVAVVEGVNEGTKKLLDNTVRGAYKVATLGQGELESYEVQEPEKGSGEPTKIKISIPGT